jgi:hypothetical protein
MHGQAERERAPRVAGLWQGRNASADPPPWPRNGSIMLKRRSPRQGCDDEIGRATAAAAAAAAAVAAEADRCDVTSRAGGSSILIYRNVDEACGNR